MAGKIPWSRRESCEKGNNNILRYWERGVNSVTIQDVSDDQYYKVNYLVNGPQDKNSGFVTPCDAAGYVVETYGVIPVGSVWERESGERYVVKHNNPVTLPEDHEAYPSGLYSGVPVVYCFAPDDEDDYVWLARTAFKQFELLDWSL